MSRPACNATAYSASGLVLLVAFFCNRRDREAQHDLKKVSL